MKNLAVLQTETFFIYWNGILQKVTKNKSEISDYLGSQANHNGISEMDRYTINSNFSEGYKVSDFISFENFN